MLFSAKQNFFSTLKGIKKLSELRAPESVDINFWKLIVAMKAVIFYQTTMQQWGRKVVNMSLLFDKPVVSWFQITDNSTPSPLEKRKHFKILSN